MYILPSSTLFDGVEYVEGSLDPLGIYNLSEILANRIGSSGVRERQTNLRFLTICCVGWEVISALELDLKPGDPGSTAEQAFEWIVVEALVQGNKPDSSQHLSIPGIQKAQDAIKQSLHLNSDRYLSMPGTFGFFGVYRTLAEYLGVVIFAGDDGAILGLEGARILDAWRADQDLPGFGRERQGKGQDLCRALVACLRDSYREGGVVENRVAFKMVQDLLHPGQVGGIKEAEVLNDILFKAGGRDDDDHRRQLLRMMVDPEVVALMSSKEKGLERKFHAIVARQATPSLLAVLKGIEAYEGFVGVLQGAFDELRRVLTPESGLVPTEELSGRSKVFAAAAKACPDRFNAAHDALTNLGMASRFDEMFGAFSSKLSPLEWLEALLGHHERIQKHKPPSGKAPWFELKGGKVGVRPLYRLDSEPRGEDEYVYFYRTTPLFNFLQSLKVPSGKA